MKHTHFLIITMILALVMCVVLFSRKSRTADPTNTEGADLLKQTILLQSAAFNHLQVAGDSATDTDGKRVALDDVFHNRRLVLRFTEENCDVCVETELQALRKLGLSIGDSNIVILASYARQRDFKIICQTYQIGVPAYNIPPTTILSPIEKANRPYLFVLDSVLNAGYLFIPNKEIPDISASYYQMVGKLWKASDNTHTIAATGDTEPTTLSIDNYAHRFGTLQPGEDATAIFTITNTGKNPLVLKEVQATCGCTVPEWSQQPVSPGQTATVKLKYDTHIKGIFSKKAFIFSNAKGSPHGISISGEVQE